MCPFGNQMTENYAKNSKLIEFVSTFLTINIIEKHPRDFFLIIFVNMFFKLQKVASGATLLEQNQRGDRGLERCLRGSARYGPPLEQNIENNTTRKSKLFSIKKCP